MTDVERFRKNAPYVLHYATKEYDGDIPVFSFATMKDFQDFIENKIVYDKKQYGGLKKSNTIYLFTFDLFKGDGDEPEIYITERIALIADLLNNEIVFGFDLLFTFYLQEYSSYEEAYNVALSMRETSNLCYEQD